MYNSNCEKFQFDFRKKFDFNQIFEKISILVKFVKNFDFSKNFRLNLDFSQILEKISILV